MTWLDRASCTDKMEQDLCNIIITLRTFLTAGRNLSSRDKQEVNFNHCAVCLHRSVLHLICSSVYTHHVVFAFGKTLWRRQTHSLKSLGHQNFYRYIEKGGSCYIDISASDETFRLCVAVRNCFATPAGNNLARIFYCSFHQKTASTHKLKIEKLRINFVAVGNT
jgi:hypothetical protein